MDDTNSVVPAIDDVNFELKIGAAKKPVLVDFWAPWCGPCTFLSPIIEEIAATQTDADVYKMNTDENPETSGKFGIMSIPTVVIFKDKEVKEVFVGVQDKQVYLDAIKKYV